MQSEQDTRSGSRYETVKTLYFLFFLFFDDFFKRGGILHFLGKFYCFGSYKTFNRPLDIEIKYKNDAPYSTPSKDILFL